MAVVEPELAVRVVAHESLSDGLVAVLQEGRLDHEEERHVIVQLEISGHLQERRGKGVTRKGANITQGAMISTGTRLQGNSTAESSGLSGRFTKRASPDVVPCSRRYADAASLPRCSAAAISLRTLSCNVASACLVRPERNAAKSWGTPDGLLSRHAHTFPSRVWGGVRARVRA